MTNLLYSAKHYQIKTAKDADRAKNEADRAKSYAETAWGKINNVGDIFFTSRLDTELNGAVECNGGIYSTLDFTGEQNIGSLLAKGFLPYVSLEEYTSIVSTNGSCRAFGWDGGTEFRVPTLNDVYIEAGHAETFGEFISESLPNITGSFSGAYHSDYSPGQTGAFTNSEWGAGNRIGRDGTIGWYRYYNFSASNSNAVYRDGAKVKPNSIRYRAMVQLANSTTDEAVITATSALQQIANKIDRTETTYIIETFSNGSSWYRVWSDGWCEQGGYLIAASNPQTITFLKTYNNNNYNIQLTTGDPDTNSSVNDVAIYQKTPSDFTFVSGYNGTFYVVEINWEAKGYLW